MLEQMGKQAKDAAFILAQLNTTEKNHAWEKLLMGAP